MSLPNIAYEISGISKTVSFLTCISGFPDRFIRDFRISRDFPMNSRFSKVLENHKIISNVSKAQPLSDVTFQVRHGMLYVILDCRQNLIRHFEVASS